ncbi:GNAT family N-acetyltransferase [Celerinatantimonas yamalensis]|uniref:GNAT family N-acetyltransferase n=1 Tax=Celerinatantimonas yamalensis TaxID=559956 RepID=A0ABW9GBC6_9GAMM
MITIVDSLLSDIHLETYRQWISEEWGQDHSFESLDRFKPLPSPLLAMVGERLAGGISFTWHIAPDYPKVALWINTVYVEPAFRGKGIARTLIAAADEHARTVTEEETLLVYTNVPQLYEENEWVPTRQEGEMWVLRKEL